MYLLTMSYDRVYCEHVLGNLTYIDMGFIFCSMSRVNLTFIESYISLNSLFTSICNLFPYITRGRSPRVIHVRYIDTMYLWASIVVLKYMYCRDGLYKCK
jgi:hypothetical protein